ncbi:hypothetical protein L3Q82_010975 [Scortum barcoo]|uniref:Uncharacterized protein n=1 Tax=Scortum barcoo TaxID=214431 RepID=A0ACB8W8Q8_9TELE|nr:hypothetical protein L3Q82_010975 [Scortum barcoo]
MFHDQESLWAQCGDHLESGLERPDAKDTDLKTSTPPVQFQPAWNHNLLSCVSRVYLNSCSPKKIGLPQVFILLYTLRRVLEGLWEFAQPVHMCFVDLEKAFDRVPRGILWGGVLREYMGSGGLC